MSTATAPAVPAIYKAISATMADVGAVSKDATNQFDRYKYRSIDAVMNAMYPAMAKNHLFVIPEVMEITREDRKSDKDKNLVYSVVKVCYTFATDDGSSVKAVVIGEGSDRGDKSINKAMSAAFKYALFQVFCIPTEEMVDSERDSDGFKPQSKEAPAPESFPGLDWARRNPKEQINAEQVEAITRRAAEASVPAQAICAVYKVAELAAMKNFQYIDVMTVHWDAMVKAAEAYKQAPERPKEAPQESRLEDKPKEAAPAKSAKKISIADL